MPRPPEMPANLELIGQRVRWWREYRKMSRKELAAACKMSVSTLSDLELDRTKKGGYLHLIAAALRLNPHYLQTGKGEPESAHAQEPAPEMAQWPFEAVRPGRLLKYNIIERRYAESRLAEAIEDIERERRKLKKAD